MFRYFTLICLMLIMLSCAHNKTKNNLVLFVGAASQPATEEIITAFEEKYRFKIEANYGGSGYMLSQMILSQQADIYFPGSSDFMELAKDKNQVLPESIQKICYLVSSINVQKNNPKNINGLKDLLRPDVSLALANPENVCVGTYAVEILENSLSEEEIELLKSKLINYTESCSKTATAISLKMADATIGWRVFENWDSTRVENIALKQNELVRVGYIPIAISQHCKQTKKAQLFIDFILSEEGKNIFRKHGYFMSEFEAFAYIGTEKQIGGTYKLPPHWYK